MTGGAGSERTRARMRQLEQGPATESYYTAQYVAADLDALASRLAKIEAMPDIAQRLATNGLPRMNSASSTAAPPSDEEIVLAMKQAYWEHAPGSTTDEVMYHVLAALRARGGTIR